MLARRNLLTSLLFAPAIIRPGLLMPVKPVRLAQSISGTFTGKLPEKIGWIWGPECIEPLYVDSERRYQIGWVVDVGKHEWRIVT